MAYQTPKGCDRIPKESRRATDFDSASVSSILITPVQPSAD